MKLKLNKEMVIGASLFLLLNAAPHEQISHISDETRTGVSDTLKHRVSDELKAELQKRFPPAPKPRTLEESIQNIRTHVAKLKFTETWTKNKLRMLLANTRGNHERCLDSMEQCPLKAINPFCNDWRETCDEIKTFIEQTEKDLKSTPEENKQHRLELKRICEDQLTEICSKINDEVIAQAELACKQIGEKCEKTELFLREIDAQENFDVEKYNKILVDSKETEGYVKVSCSVIEEDCSRSLNDPACKKKLDTCSRIKTEAKKTGPSVIKQRIKDLKIRAATQRKKAALILKECKNLKEQSCDGSIRKRAIDVQRDCQKYIDICGEYVE